MEKCFFIYRVSVHPSVVVGGASLGPCKRHALPGMTVCSLHATREAMAYYIRQLYEQNQELKKQLQHALKGKNKKTKGK